MFVYVMQAAVRSLAENVVVRAVLGGRRACSAGNVVVRAIRGGRRACERGADRRGRDGRRRASSSRRSSRQEADRPQIGSSASRQEAHPPHHSRQRSCTVRCFFDRTTSYPDHSYKPPITFRSCSRLGLRASAPASVVSPRAPSIRLLPSKACGGGVVLSQPARLLFTLIAVHLAASRTC